MMMNRLSYAAVLLLLTIGLVDCNRILAMIVPYDLYTSQSSPRQHHSRHHKIVSSNMRRSARSGSGDHLFFMDRRSIQNCAVKAEDEKTYLAMDRLCEACHEMYRHTDPNIRANCRANCFDNDDFVFCFTHFAGVQVSRGET